MFSEFFTPAGQKQIDKNLKKSVFNLYSENKTKIENRSKENKNEITNVVIEK